MRTIKELRSELSGLLSAHPEMESWDVILDGDNDMGGPWGEIEIIRGARNEKGKLKRYEQDYICLTRER